jgi:hypothetical protein
MRNAGRKLAFLLYNQTFSKQIVRAATRVILQSKITDLPSSASLTLGTFPQGKAFGLPDKRKFAKQVTIRAVP